MISMKSSNLIVLNAGQALERSRVIKIFTINSRHSNVKKVLRSWDIRSIMILGAYVM